MPRIQHNLAAVHFLLRLPFEKVSIGTSWMQESSETHREAEAVQTEDKLEDYFLLD